MSLHDFLRYLLMPARPTVLVLIAALSLGFLVAPYGGLRLPGTASRANWRASSTRSSSTRVAELARQAGDRRTARALLVDFATHFPGDGGAAQAAAMVRQLGGN